MCNLSGYVGSERAAPILIEMARKRKGFAGVYGALERLSSAGRVYRKEIRLPGVLEGITDPKSVFLRAAD